MKFRWSHAIILSAAIILMHAAGLLLGLYDQGIPIDVPQHLLAGVLFGIIWIGWIHAQNITLSDTMLFVSTISFVALLSVIWEVFEYLIWQLLPTVSELLKWRSTTVHDLIGDMVAALIGGVIIALYAVYKKR